MARYRGCFAVLLLGCMVFAAEVHAGGPVQQQQQYQQTQDVEQRALPDRPREASSTDGSKPYLNAFGYVFWQAFLECSDLSATSFIRRGTGKPAPVR